MPTSLFLSDIVYRCFVIARKTIVVNVLCIRNEVLPFVLSLKLDKK